MAETGYTRVSSKEQNLDRQPKTLGGVSRVLSDKLSGQSVERPQLQAMFDYIHEGDIVVAAESDQLGWDNKGPAELMNQIQIEGAILEVLNLPSMNGIEDENLGRLVNNLVVKLCKHQAESKCKRIKERQVQGTGTIKKRGEFKGR